MIVTAGAHQVPGKGCQESPQTENLVEKGARTLELERWCETEVNERTSSPKRGPTKPKGVREVLTANEREEKKRSRKKTKRGGRREGKVKK